MSAVAVRAALESALAAMTPSLPTAYENAPLTPTTGTAYQRATLLFTVPANDEFGSAYREEGFMQVDLFYPLNVGSDDAAARAELLRSTFTRGNSFTASGVTVHITKTPEIMPGRVDGTWFVVPVRIPFHSRIGD